MRMGLSSRQLGGSRLDPDAKLYIATVQAALGATTIEEALPNATNPKKIISDFYKAEKDAGRYALHKRIFLPIYANISANSIDMVAQEVGEFSISGVTHGAGFVQGDGATGYFDTKSKASELLLLDSGLIGIISNQADTINAGVSFSSIMGAVNSAVSSASRINIDTSSTIGSRHYSLATSVSKALTSRVSATGIFTADRTSLSRFDFRQRTSSGVTSLDVDTNTEMGLLPSRNYLLMAQSETVPTSFSNAKINCAFISSGLGNVATDEYTNNLKTLWESLTGLALP
jgi:hypothetical protein